MTVLGICLSVILVFALFGFLYGMYDADFRTILLGLILIAGIIVVLCLCQIGNITPEPAMVTEVSPKEVVTITDFDTVTTKTYVVKCDGYEMETKSDKLATGDTIWIIDGDAYIRL